MHVFTNPFTQAEYDTMSIVKWSLLVLISKLSFSHIGCHSKATLHSALLFAMVGFRFFPMVLALCEMRTKSLWI